MAQLHDTETSPDKPML